jgi:hydroxyethylthiazole kinase
MISAGATLRAIREQKPLVHQITNYVVMNETANATLALGALPVMAHAVEEVEEMTRLASSLVLNIGTLSGHWIDAMLLAGGAATARRVPVVLDPVGVGATEYRTATARRILDLVGVTVLRGNAGEVATLVGADAEVRGVESIAASVDAAELAREAARRFGLVAAVTGAVDHVSDGERVLAVANGHPLLATVTGTGCMSSALTGCFLAAKPDLPLEAAAEALAAFGVAAEDAAAGAQGPGTFHARLYDALYALDPAVLDARTRIEELCGSTRWASSGSSPSSSAAGSRKASSTTPRRSEASSSRRTRSSRVCISALTCSHGASSAFALPPPISAISRHRVQSRLR